MRSRLLEVTKTGLAVLALLALPMSVSGQAPHLQPNNSWISIDGTVDAVSMNAFMLDYGSGVITVEMDDGDRDADGYKLVPGDEVTVSGRIDDDLFETASIEASSVYVKNLGTYFTASAIDDEDAFFAYLSPLDASEVMLLGTVTDVSGNEFTIDSGATEITVETREMPYDPLDDEGYQKIEVGDYVSVSGDIEFDLLEGRKIVAETVSTITTQ